MLPQKSRALAKQYRLEKSTASVDFAIPYNAVQNTALPMLCSSGAISYFSLVKFQLIFDFAARFHCSSDF
jgi:hypothetical protein